MIFVSTEFIISAEPKFFSQVELVLNYQLNIFFLSFILHLLHILVENISEILPATLRDEDGVAIVSLDLRDGHVAPLLVPLDVEVEVLVLDPYVLILGSTHGILGIT